MDIPFSGPIAMYTSWWPVALCGAASLGFLVEGLRRLRQTTLVAPIVWAMLAVVAAVAGGPGRSSYLAYTTAVLFIAPTLAALGAKRPQNGAWQFIVLTLLVVLLMPVLQGRAMGDPQPHVHTLFRWLIFVHIAIGTVNYLPTRYAVSALFFGAAQLMLAAAYLPFDFGPITRAELAALLYSTIALAWAWFAARQAPRVAPGLDRLWRDFRDAYGLVWGLRIAERLNVAARQHGWPVEFAWSGVVWKCGVSETSVEPSPTTTDGEMIDDETRHRVERELRSYLRRFVSHDWIARRLPHDDAPGRPQA